MTQDRRPTLRLAAATGIRPEALDRYCALHANPWPEVQAALKASGLSNYSIFLLRQRNLVFSYSEYTGHDRARDREKMAANPAMQEWWSVCRPCQEPLVPVEGERRWADLEPIFRLD